jgi:hypothetical protein
VGNHQYFHPLIITPLVSIRFLNCWAQGMSCEASSRSTLDRINLHSSMSKALPPDCSDTLILTCVMEL